MTWPNLELAFAKPLTFTPLPRSWKTFMPDKREKIRKAVSGAKHKAGARLGDIWWWFLIRGVLMLGLAIFALFWPQKTIALMVNILGAYLLIDGVLGIVGALRSSDKRSVPMLAVAGLVLGAVLLFWTGVSVKTFLVLVGAWALVQGVGMFFTSRGKDNDLESSQLVGTVGAVLAIAGLILVLWPNTGVVAVSWLFAGIMLVVGSVMIFVSLRLRKLALRLDAA